MRLLGILSASLLALSYAVSTHAANVPIKGLHADLLSDIQDILPTPADLTVLPNTPPPPWTKTAQHQITQALEVLGYYHAHIVAKPIHGQWGFQVNLGAPTRIDGLDLIILDESTSGKQSSTLLRQEALVQGAVFNHTAYEQTKRFILAKAIGAGFLDAHWTTHQVVVDKVRSQANIALHLTLGRPYYFDKTHWETPYFHPHFLKRFQNFQAGDRFSHDQLLALQTDLKNTGYFNEVTVTPVLDDSDADRIPIQIQGTLRQAQDLSLGIGYGSDTGLRAQLNWQWHYLNRLGHALEADSKFSEIGQRYRIQYRIPGKQPAETETRFEWLRTQEAIEHHHTASQQFGVAWIQASAPWRNTWELQYHTTDFKTHSGARTATRRFLLPSAQWSTIQVDHRIHPTQGFRFDSTARVGLDILQSNEHYFLQWIQHYQHFFAKDSHRFNVRGDLGLTLGELDDLPLSMRFFAGGDRSVRGFDYQSIAPQNHADSTGRTTTGGKHLITASAQYHYVISDRWQAVAFVDTGQAPSRWLERFYTGAGIGIHLSTPVGPLRIEAARPLRHGHRYRTHWHINIGPVL